MLLESLDSGSQPTLGTPPTPPASLPQGTPGSRMSEIPRLDQRFSTYRQHHNNCESNYLVTQKSIVVKELQSTKQLHQQITNSNNAGTASKSKQSKAGGGGRANKRNNSTNNDADGQTKPTKLQKLNPKPSASPATNTLLIPHASSSPSSCSDFKNIDIKPSPSLCAPLSNASTPSRPTSTSSSSTPGPGIYPVPSANEIKREKVDSSYNLDGGFIDDLSSFLTGAVPGNSSENYLIDPMDNDSFTFEGLDSFAGSDAYHDDEFVKSLLSDLQDSPPSSMSRPVMNGHMTNNMTTVSNRMPTQFNSSHNETNMNSPPFLNPAKPRQPTNHFSQMLTQVANGNTRPLGPSFPSAVNPQQLHNQPVQMQPSRPMMTPTVTNSMGNKPFEPLHNTVAQARPMLASTTGINVKHNIPNSPNDANQVSNHANSPYANPIANMQNMNNVANSHNVLRPSYGQPVPHAQRPTISQPRQTFSQVGPNITSSNQQQLHQPSLQQQYQSQQQYQQQYQPVQQHYQNQQQYQVASQQQQQFAQIHTQQRPRMSINQQHSNPMQNTAYPAAQQQWINQQRPPMVPNGSQEFQSHSVQIQHNQWQQSSVGDNMRQMNTGNAWEANHQPWHQ